jgi:hypothetical protein
MGHTAPARARSCTITPCLAGRAAALEKIAERHARTRITQGDDDARR